MPVNAFYLLNAKCSSRLRCFTSPQDFCILSQRSHVVLMRTNPYSQFGKTIYLKHLLFVSVQSTLFRRLPVSCRNSAVRLHLQRHNVQQLPSLHCWCILLSKIISNETDLLSYIDQQGKTTSTDNDALSWPFVYCANYFNSYHFNAYFPYWKWYAVFYLWVKGSKMKAYKVVLGLKWHFDRTCVVF